MKNPVLFQSAPRERGERGTFATSFRFILVSIRAPRAGRKESGHGDRVEPIEVSIRAPRAGRKGLMTVQCLCPQCFNPRPASGAKVF